MNIYTHICISIYLSIYLYIYIIHKQKDLWVALVTFIIETSAGIVYDHAKEQVLSPKPSILNPKP